MGVQEMKRKSGGKFLMMAALFTALVSIFMGRSLMQVMADEDPEVRCNKYYTSIRLDSGDTLWTIADEYNTFSGKSTEEYVRELRRMNSLSDDQIHEGHYLTIAYYEPVSQ